jgi:hypothetical protein
MVGKIDEHVECPEEIKPREPVPVTGPGEENENEKRNNDIFKENLKEQVKRRHDRHIYEKTVKKRDFKRVGAYKEKKN